MLISTYRDERCDGCNAFFRDAQAVVVRKGSLDLHCHPLCAGPIAMRVLDAGADARSEAIAVAALEIFVAAKRLQVNEPRERRASWEM